MVGGERRDERGRERAREGGGRDGRKREGEGKGEEARRPDGVRTIIFATKATSARPQSEINSSRAVC